MKCEVFVNTGTVRDQEGKKRNSKMFNTLILTLSNRNCFTLPVVGAHYHAGLEIERKNRSYRVFLNWSWLDAYFK
jgi:hypothetical protein